MDSNNNAIRKWVAVVNLEQWHLLVFFGFSVHSKTNLGFLQIDVVQGMPTSTLTLCTSLCRRSRSPGFSTLTGTLARFPHRDEHDLRLHSSYGVMLKRFYMCKLLLLLMPDITHVDG